MGPEASPADTFPTDREGSHMCALLALILHMPLHIPVFISRADAHFAGVRLGEGAKRRAAGENDDAADGEADHGVFGRAEGDGGASTGK